MVGREFTTDAEWAAYEAGVEDGLAGLEEAVNDEVGRRFEFQQAIAVSLLPVPPFEDEKCTVHGCKIRQLEQGFCGLHYRRFRLTGDESDTTNDPLWARCSLPKCTNKISSRGICKTHYNLWLAARKIGQAKEYVGSLYDPDGMPYCPPAKTPPSRMPIEVRLCSVPRCAEKHSARGMCHKHYAGWGNVRRKRGELAAEGYYAKLMRGGA